MFHGMGHYKYNGNTYIGQFVSGKFEGKVICRLTIGVTDIFRWKNL
jgi:hypothetical protein